MKKRRSVVWLLIIIFLLVIVIYFPYYTGDIVFERNENNEKRIDYEPIEATIVKVVDGDTIKVNNMTDSFTVRLLGINTPEKGKYLYKEAKNFLEDFENMSVKLLRDSVEIDKYDRKLMYLFIDSRLINIELLENGLATSFMTDELYYKEKIINAEKFARNNEIGLWEKSNEKCSKCIELIELNPIEEYFILRNNCEQNCELNGWIVKDDANHFIKMKMIEHDSEERFESKGKIWNNDGDRMFLRDSVGKLVIYHEY